MQTHDSSAEKLASYSQLQSSLDQVIGKIGLQRTINLLDGLLSPSQPAAVRESARVRLVTEYLVSEATRLFALDENHFYSSHIREYREARMCCYYLLRKYTDASFPKIGLDFRCSERKVIYGANKCAERMTFPQGHKEFTGTCEQLETRLLVFLSHLN